MAVGKSRDPRASRYSRLSVAPAQNNAASWEEADPDQLWRTVIAVTQAGDAIMFGKTRDGGALVLTVLSGDERVKAYAHDPEETQKLLADTRAAAEDSQ